MGSSDIQTGGFNRLMEDLARVHIYSILLHVPLIQVIINTMTQILHGIEIFPVKVNRHKLDLQGLCAGMISGYSPAQRIN